jgi:hypothetical protein
MARSDLYLWSLIRVCKIARKMRGSNRLWNENCPGALSYDEAGGQKMDSKSLLIGALLVGVGVLGYLYWDSQHNTVFKAPGVEIRKN